DHHQGARAGAARVPLIVDGVRIAIVASRTGQSRAARGAKTVDQFTSASAIALIEVVASVGIAVIAGSAWKRCPTGSAFAVDHHQGAGAGAARIPLIVDRVRVA